MQDNLITRLLRQTAGTKTKREIRHEELVRAMHRERLRRLEDVQPRRESAVVEIVRRDVASARLMYGHDEHTKAKPLAMNHI